MLSFHLFAICRIDVPRFLWGQSAKIVIRQTNLTYGTRLPNLPYLYAGTDMALTWLNIDRRGGKLSLTYDNLYQHSFPLYAENLGSKDSKEMVPEQFAHNLTAAYNFAGGRFSLAVECRNLTNAKLYDNYSLQKPGRAFFATVRVAFGQDRAARHKSHQP